MAFEVKLDIFEGPVDMLLKMVENEELDIDTLPISEITDQYLSYVRRSKEFDVEQASNLLNVVVRLLSIKSGGLMPETAAFTEMQEEMDPRELLAKHLLEYRTFKEAAGFFKERLDSEGKTFIRGSVGEYVQSVDASGSLEGLEIADLVTALENVLAAGAENAAEDAQVEVREIKVSDRIAELMPWLYENRSGVDFYSLFPGSVTRREIVVTFLALLELVRVRKIRIVQEGNFNTIMIYAIGDGEDDQ